MENMIDPTRLKGWRIARTWPTLNKPWSPELVWEYLEIWGASGYVPLVPAEKWYDGYVRGSGYEQFATIFDNIDYAIAICVIMESRWPKTKFVIIPYYEG